MTTQTSLAPSRLTGPYGEICVTDDGIGLWNLDTQISRDAAAALITALAAAIGVPGHEQWWRSGFLSGVLYAADPDAGPAAQITEITPAKAVELARAALTQARTTST